MYIFTKIWGIRPPKMPVFAVLDPFLGILPFPNGDIALKQNGISTAFYGKIWVL